MTEAVRTLPRLPPRRAEGHKGDYGRVLLIGGSRGMSGSISLAGMAALRGGAGLVTLAVPAGGLPIVAAHEPSYMTEALEEDDHGRISAAALPRLVELAERATVVALGPGLGQSDDLTNLVGRLYAEVSKPMVIDADALNALAARRERLPAHAAARVLTPHPGEFARLSREPNLADRAASERLAAELAAAWDVVLILKGHRSLITDGKRQATNMTGNPGMATGGSGDVLTGLTAALLAQGLGPFEAAQLGAHVHGLAGDLAAETLGQVSLIASDLIRWLHAAFQQAAR